MKIIQDREVDRICTMVASEDPNMRALAIKIIKGKEKVRLSFSVITFLYALWVIFTMVIAIYFSYLSHFGLYWIPTIATLTFNFIFCTMQVLAIISQRKVYNQQIKNLID